MKKIILLLTLTLFSFNGFAQVWENQNSGVKITLRDVCFVDTLNGWAVGDSSTILSTIDGGKNWISKKYSSINYTFLKVQFVSKNVGYIISANNLILSTKDGGMNWNSIAHGYDIDFRDISFISENEGWLAGYKTYADHGIGLILHTADGGKNFEKQLEIISQSQFGAKFFRAIKFQDNNVGWALSVDEVDNFSPTFIYRTSDGGKTWAIISQINSNQLKLKIASNDTLWVGGTSYSYFAISFDGGVNWNINQNDNNYAIAFYPKSGLKGWICNYKLSSGNLKKILYANDTGNTWKEELQLQQFVLGMSLIDEHLWIVGEQGLIMKRSPLISSIESNNIIPSSYNLYQNYPNPFNNSTVIEYQIPRNCFITLIIYDALGREVEMLINEFQNTGVHKIKFNANGLTSGVYIIVLNSSIGITAKKITYLK